MDFIGFTRQQFEALDNLITSILQAIDIAATEPITNAEIDSITEEA